MQGKEADLKLTKSKVHAWGLVAVKPIEAQQFVIEYTGELIRLSVNANREKLDSDSDYRFRVDDEWVVDATTKVTQPIRPLLPTSMAFCDAPMVSNAAVCCECSEVLHRMASQLSQAMALGHQMSLLSSQTPCGISIKHEVDALRFTLVKRGLA